MAGASLWLYRVLLHGLLPAAVPAIWLKDRLRGKARPSFVTRLGRQLPEIARGGVWIQAVSVGEVELARRLVDELQVLAPELPLLLTSTTATGLALARLALGQRLVVLPCPLDLPAAVGPLLDHAAPRLVVLVETELWPETLHQAARRGIPVAVINARLSNESFARYRRVRGLLRPLLEPVTRVLARSAEDVSRFEGLGVPAGRIDVSGNIKFDLRAASEPLPWHDQVLAAAAGRPVVVAGSTMEGEERAVLDAVDALASPGDSKPGPRDARGGWRRLLLVMAPRHPERFDAVAGVLASRGVRHVRRSDAGGLEALRRPDASAGCDVLLLDTIGELSRAYGLADLAFIGGSLVPTGGHNPLEPAVWGVPVLSGPHVQNFREIYDELLRAGATRIVGNAAELAEGLDRWLERPDEARLVGTRAREVVERNRGATRRTADELLRLAGMARP